MSRRAPVAGLLAAAALAAAGVTLVAATAVLGAGALTAAAAAPRAATASPPAAPATSEETRLRRAAELRGLALADMEEANYGRAVERLQELERLLPDNVLPPVNLAICYLKLGRQQEALAALERARALRPDNPNLLYTEARVLELEPGLADRWRAVVDRFAAVHPSDPRPHYLRARALEEEGRTGAALPALQAALARDPENLVLLADRLVAAAFAASQDAAAVDDTQDALDAIEDRLDGFEGSLADYAEQLRGATDGAADGDDPAALRPIALVIRNLLRPTELYQVCLVPLTGGRQQGGALFPQQDFDPPLPKSVQGGQDIALQFAESAPQPALAGLSSDLHLVPERSPQPGERLVGHDGNGWQRIDFAGGQARASTLTIPPPVAGLVGAFDFDQDEQTDLAIATAREVRLLPGDGAGGYGAGRSLYRPPSEGAAPAVLGLFPVEIDHDGDLDLFVARAGADLYLQNNGDGSWSERASELGIAGGAEPTTAAVVADYDDDGDLDLLTLHPRSRPRLYDNRRAGALREIGEAAGLAALPAGLAAAALLDFDRDGRFDLLLWGDGGARLLRSKGGTFEPAELPQADSDWSAAAVGDFDNDGDPDIVAALAGRDGEAAVLLLRNRRDRWVVEPTGLAAGSAAGDRLYDLLAGDYDDDGDLDLLAQTRLGPPRLWRNDGGNRNHWLRLALRGLSDNNSKNNTQGLFTRIEARVGDALQTLPGNGAVNHLGLGASRQADVVRVVWTNGLAQSWQRLSADRTLVEEQVLKGSCPFLYTFDGERFRFVTDLMWRSPLGMTLPDGSAAPHQSARDWVLVPGEALQPVGGTLWLQVTEELWEAAYVDRQYLMAIDHPAGTELVVDERFTPPPYPRQAPLHLVGRTLAPVAARDHLGHDVLAKLAARDGDYVDDLPLDRYQGLTHGQSVELSFAGVPAGERLRLLLSGWIFPTDSSINFALAQDASRDPRPPSLELRTADGGWRTLVPSIGFPNGKRKTMVIELTDLLTAEELADGDLADGTLTLRLATNLQIYWDQAALAVGDPLAEAAAGVAAPWTITQLEPATAELHQRGFSRLYRESATGPHLFDYRHVAVESPFRPMLGTATPAGPVTPLLAAEDSQSVVMIAGHEMTVTFDATRLPPLPDGYRRDYVLYTDGWVKDADLHTAHGQTIEPIPHRGMDGYR